ncbi:MAG: ABC transporter ATP-binding protein [Kouleothrix sp.]|nr:ABC transporter ATP-binding protein [Kouleothrix sp.]
MGTLHSTLMLLRHLSRALRLVWSTARTWTTAWIALLVAQGLLPVATVYLSKSLVDSLTAAVGARGDWPAVRPTLILAGLMVGVMVLAEVLQAATEWVRTAQSELVQDHISALIHAKSAAVDLAFYETPEYHDHLYQARDEAGTRPLALVESLGSLLQNGITLVAMAGVLLPYAGWLPLALLASTLPALAVVARHTLRSHQWSRRTTADRRRGWYYDWVLTGSENAAELRLFGLGAHFAGEYQALRRRLRAESLRLIRDRGVATLGAGIVALLISGAALAWMVWRALLGLVTLGDLALFYQAFSRGQGLMRGLLMDVGHIYGNSLFLGNLFEFLGLESRVTDPPDPRPAPAALASGIRFRDVTFRYPGGERTALQGFDLLVPAGQTVAIVGANGAGKTTLVKLLCRFYDPEQGRVELDGVDIRDLALDELRRLVTVLFQQPVQYQATAAENIALGDLAAADRADVEAAARGAGAHELIARLPRGYDTQLGKWFADGSELSGGEWQRVALARAFLRQAPIIMLDEPTSFMDSWAEADWFDRLRRLAAGRTAIIITHRFTIAMRADVIHVMDAGRIVESGSHAELLERDGLYAQSWAAQMRAAPELWA